MSTAARLIEYIENLQWAGGDHDAEQVELLAWEKRFIRGTFGRGKRGTAAISCARGNGKSALVSTLATAVADPRGALHSRRAEVVIVASSFDQSRIVFEDCKLFLSEQLRDRREWRVQDSANRALIEHRESGARIRCLGSDPARMMGLRPKLAICDEPASWDHTKADKAISALRTSLGKVGGSRLIALGTRASSKVHWFSKLLESAAYSQVHAAAPEDAPFSVRTWRKANPSWDHLPSLREVIRDEAAGARRDPALMASFRSLRLNGGTHDVQVMELLTLAVWESIEGEAEAVGPVFWGCDLGGQAASSAVAGYWPESGKLVCICAFPSEPGLEERGLADGCGGMYVDAGARGELLQLGGRAIDVTALLAAAYELFGPPAGIAADRWKADRLIDGLKAARIPRAPLDLRGQGFRDGATDVAAFKRACLQGEVTPEPSLMLASAIGEARLVSDVIGNQKLAINSDGGRRRTARDDCAAASVVGVAMASRRRRKHGTGFYLGAA